MDDYQCLIGIKGLIPTIKLHRQLVDREITITLATITIVYMHTSLLVITIDDERMREIVRLTILIRSTAIKHWATGTQLAEYHFLPELGILLVRIITITVILHNVTKLGRKSRCCLGWIGGADARTISGIHSLTTMSHQLSYGISLGTISLRGETGTLSVGLETLMRVTSNPFFPWMMTRVDERIACGEQAAVAACLKAQARAEALKQDQVQNGTQQDTDDRRGSHEAEQADKP